MSYYERCCNSYKAASTARRDIYSFDLAVIDPHAPTEHDLITLPHDWLTMVETVADDVNRKLDQGTDVYQPPGLMDDPARRLASPQEVNGIRPLLRALVQPIEQALFGCYLVVDKLHIFRQLVTQQIAPSGGSWTWHVDGHLSEFINVQ